MLDISNIKSKNNINEHDLMIINYIILKYNNIKQFPKIALSEIAYFINKDISYVMHRLAFLEKEKMIIIEKDSKTPLYYRFYPYNEKYKKAIMYRKK